MPSATAIHGALLGTIVGDAMGLPYEALSRRRAGRLLGPPDRYRFIFGRGMMSDDGEHACMTAQALCESGGDVARFQRSLAKRLRFWLLGIPAGIGGATLRSTFKLLVGFPPGRSGVFSAGNGPAMRSAVLGAAVDDLSHLRELVIASTQMTHTDPKAYHGAMAVALAARSAAAGARGESFVEQCRSVLANDQADPLIELLERAHQSARGGQSTVAFAEQIGCATGVSGYIYATVPVAIHAWLAHPTDFPAAIAAAIACGGDTDTVAAITGGIVASATGISGIPSTWRDSLLEWPRSRAWIAELAERVHEAVTKSQPVTTPNVGPAVVPRNALFLLVVLIHIARRAFPPY